MTTMLQHNIFEHTINIINCENGEIESSINQIADGFLLEGSSHTFKTPSEAQIHFENKQNKKDKQQYFLNLK
jgi:hypothetical protein